MWSAVEEGGREERGGECVRVCECEHVPAVLLCSLRIQLASPIPRLSERKPGNEATS